MWKLGKIDLSGGSLLALLKNSHVQVTLLKSAVIVLAVMAAYFQDFMIIFSDALYNSESSYILLMPFLFAYLIFRKRKLLFVNAVPNEREVQRRYFLNLSTLVGFLLCLLAFIVYTYGSQTFMPLQYHLITLPFFVAGLILIVFNPRVLRESLFSIAFITFLTPLPSDFLNKAGATLSVFATEAGNSLVNIVGISSWISSESGVPTINLVRSDGLPMSFAVDIPCSGLYSLISFIIFAAFVAYVVRGTIRKKVAIFGIGFPLIYLLNILRITSIILIGYQWGADIAMEAFHLLGGWVLIFIGMIILFTLSDRISKIRFFNSKPVDMFHDDNAFSFVAQEYHNLLERVLKRSKMKFKSVGTAKLVGVIIVALLVAYVQTPAFALTQGPAPIFDSASSDGQKGNVRLFPQIENYEVSFLYRDVEFEELSGQDYSLSYVYSPQLEADSAVWVSLEVAETTKPLHPWEVCLVEWPQSHGYQATVTQLDLRDVAILENPPVVARYFAFQDKRTNQIQLVMYWFESTILDINGTAQQKNVKLSLITFLDDPEDVSDAEEQLFPFAKAIVEYWEPIKTWNTAMLLISALSLPIAIFIVMAMGALLVSYLLKTRNEYKLNTSAYPKLSKANKLLLHAIQEAEKTVPTLDNIAEAYEKATSQPIAKDQLLKDLEELEKTGFLKSYVLNRRDNPMQIWKTKFLKNSSYITKPDVTGRMVNDGN